MSAMQFYAAHQIKHMPIDELSIVLGAGCFAATTYLLASAYQKYREAMRPKVCEGIYIMSAFLSLM